MKIVIRKIVVAISIPILILALLIAFDEIILNTNNILLNSITNSALHFICFWPLKLITGLGLVKSNDEGFYNNWADYSLLFSIIVQSLIIFIIYKPKNAYT